MRKRPRKVTHLLLVGCNQRTYDFANGLLSRLRSGYNIVGYVDDVPRIDNSYPLDSCLKYLGTLREFDAIVNNLQVDEVAVTLPIRSCYEDIRQIIELCELRGLELHLVADFFPVKTAHTHVCEFAGMPFLTLKTGALSLWQSRLKRVFDLVAALALLVLCTPIVLLTALLIKLFSSHGPVFFKQQRIGYRRRPFTMIKFRTMVPEAERLQPELEELNEVQGPVFKIKRDPRITPIGKILRRTSIDELPQLFNVIAGDMSLVGPRPLPLRDVARFEASWLQRRFSVKPGITCLWQVNGRSRTNFDDWIKQDLQYIDEWSFGLDLRILAKTLPAVFRGTGAY